MLQFLLDILRASHAGNCFPLLRNDFVWCFFFFFSFFLSFVTRSTYIASSPSHTHTHTFSLFISTLHISTHTFRKFPPDPRDPVFFFSSYLSGCVCVLVRQTMPFVCWGCLCCVVPVTMSCPPSANNCHLALQCATALYALSALERGQK